MKLWSKIKRWIWDAYHPGQVHPDELKARRIEASAVVRRWQAQCADAETGGPDDIK